MRLLQMCEHALARTNETAVRSLEDIALLCEQREKLRTHIRRHCEKARCLRRRQRESWSVLKLAAESREQCLFNVGNAAFIGLEVGAHAATGEQSCCHEYRT